MKGSKYQRSDLLFEFNFIVLSVWFKEIRIFLLKIQCVILDIDKKVRYVRCVKKNFARNDLVSIKWFFFWKKHAFLNMTIDIRLNRLAITCLTRIIDLYQHQIPNQIKQSKFIISFRMVLVAHIRIFTHII